MSQDFYVEIDPSHHVELKVGDGYDISYKVEVTEGGGLAITCDQGRLVVWNSRQGTSFVRPEHPQTRHETPGAQYPP